MMMGLFSLLNWIRIANYRFKYVWTHSSLVIMILFVFFYGWIEITNRWTESIEVSFNDGVVGAFPFHCSYLSPFVLCGVVLQDLEEKYDQEKHFKQYLISAVSHIIPSTGHNPFPVQASSCEAIQLPGKTFSLQQ